jgi:hypothetical protein
VKRGDIGQYCQTNWQSLGHRTSDLPNKKSPSLHPIMFRIVNMEAKKGKERDGVSLAFGIAGPCTRPARRSISSVVERMS